MKRIKSTVSYHVPHWCHCNSDMNEFNGIPKNLCRFAVKTKTGYHCALHNEPLLTDGEWVNKVPACVRATAGVKAEIISDRVDPALPAVEPKQLIKATIELYSKTVNDLINQGYPRQLAEQVAKQHLLNN